MIQRTSALKFLVARSTYDACIVDDENIVVSMQEAKRIKFISGQW